MFLPLRRKKLPFFAFAEHRVPTLNLYRRLLKSANGLASLQFPATENHSLGCSIEDKSVVSQKISEKVIRLIKKKWRAHKGAVGINGTRKHLLDAETVSKRSSQNIY